MKKLNNALSGLESSVAKKDDAEKYNASHPVVINLAYAAEGHAGGKLISKKFTVVPALVNGREVIEVTFWGTGNLKSFTVQYPLEFAKYLAPALMVIIDGSALSNETNTNW